MIRRRYDSDSLNKLSAAPQQFEELNDVAANRFKACVVDSCPCLLQDYLACSSDLQEVLQQDPNVQEAERELEEVTLLLRQSLANASPAKPRKTVAITEVRPHLE